ncbi:MAG: hypothetical protein HUU55_06325 [Myxococcales bacterium]|nr:hypothetical protein [Myxococcales bacterium]
MKRFVSYVMGLWLPIATVAGLVTACGSTAPPPVSHTPTSRPSTWLSLLENTLGLRVVELSPALLNNSTSERNLLQPNSDELVIVEPAGIRFGGERVIVGQLAGNRLTLSSPRTRKVPGGELLVDLWDKMRAKNPDYRMDTADSGKGTRRWFVLADHRMPMELLIQLAITGRLAGYAPPQWIVQDTDGQPSAVTLSGTRNCPELPMPSTTLDFPQTKAGEPHVLAVGPTVAYGSCDLSSAELIFQQKLVDLGPCFQRTVAHIPSLQGELAKTTISVVIQPDGHVQGAFAESTFLPMDRSLGNCLLQTISAPVFAQQPSTCVLSGTVMFAAGAIYDIVVQPDKPPMTTLMPPLTLVDITLSTSGVRATLTTATDNGCPSQAGLFAQTDTTDAQAVADWAARVAGNGLEPQFINIRARPGVVFGTMLQIADKLARDDGSSRLRMSLQPN